MKYLVICILKGSAKQDISVPTDNISEHRWCLSVTSVRVTKEMKLCLSDLEQCIRCINKIPLQEFNIAVDFVILHLVFMCNSCVYIFSGTHCINMGLVMLHL
jgi:hypothetical protein